MAEPFDERAFIARVESVDPDGLAELLRRPSADEEKALKAYLGDERYRRMHALALMRNVRRSLSGPRGNVVVLHGIMGGELTAVDRAGGQERIWLALGRVLGGQLERLRLNDEGRAEHDARYEVRASGMLNRYYGEALLSLSQRWVVRPFWFDWRKDVSIAAAALESQISGWFADDAPVHLVAHSLGGLVARAFIKHYPEHWAALRGRGSRLVMLGTPNHGSFVIPQVLCGLEPLVKKLALLDLRHSIADLLAILNSFAGLYQMLPSPLVARAMEPLYRAETYGDFNVPQRHLDAARQHHELLRDVVDPERMVYVAGYNQPTFCAITDWARLSSTDGYAVTTRGDGRVPHTLGLLATVAGQQVLTYYVEAAHADLVSNQQVLAALDDLLTTGTTTALPDRLPTNARERGSDAEEQQARERLGEAQAADLGDLQAFAHRLRTRSAEPARSTYVSVDERQLEEVLTRGFLSAGSGERPPEQPTLPSEPARIEIGVVCGRIDEAHTLPLDGRPVDAIAVGHYLGVKPQAAELALDRAISKQVPYPVRLDSAGEPIEADLVLTQYSERGIISGGLGQPFFLHDPRQPTRKRRAAVERVIAIAGMGEPGRFAAPELTVLARELCWALGRLGKRHLATVLIGAGNGNLAVADAVAAWLRGVKYAVTGSLEDEARHLTRITFVESDPRKVRRIHEALGQEIARLDPDRLKVTFKKLSPASLKALQNQERQAAYADLQREWARRSESQEEATDRDPTRVTIELERGIYRFGAITATASIPEREVPLDPALVQRANDELAEERDPARQRDRGRFIEGLLIPDDLRSQLYSSAPLVMLLDATTARIHWELMMQSTTSSTGGAGPRDGDGDFLGTSRGFTRQLRTLFAPPPEPPPPPRRVLRVLVVADPAEDAPLAGAEEEGVEVAELFEGFNKVYQELSYNRIEVVRLFGPREATRTNVLSHLMLRSYDVLHFAGHCYYNQDDPPASGWVFNLKDKEVLTANELQRIDRIPKFVFSNACESGITPDRAELRSVGLAPSFAEAFFARGVSNFVCTAWPVDDLAARWFALRLYGGLLGLERDNEGSRYRQVAPQPMHKAMRDARLFLATMPNGVRTWGAYQHYGNPYLRFFDPTTMLRPQAPSVGREQGAASPP